MTSRAIRAGSASKTNRACRASGFLGLVGPVRREEPVLRLVGLVGPVGLVRPVGLVELVGLVDS